MAGRPATFNSDQAKTLNDLSIQHGPSRGGFGCNQESTPITSPARRDGPVVFSLSLVESLDNFSVCFLPWDIQTQLHASLKGQLN